MINPILENNNILKGDGDFIINGVLYELKCLNNSNYECGNSIQLMFYYILNELNKYIEKSLVVNRIAGYPINELKIFNPRYEAIMGFDIRLQMDLLELGEIIVELVKLNSKLYGEIFDETIMKFINNKQFIELSDENKIREVYKFYKTNDKYKFILNNKDCNKFIRKIIYDIEFRLKQSLNK